ncbi:MAG: CDP-alcohol phosphatidyltransferase [Mycobacterium sp.]|nr:CDP-alcohol phosphatidyltransferase [Mycobacterium sp.]
MTPALAGLLAVVAAGAVALAAAAARWERRPSAAVPDGPEYLRLWSAEHGGYDMAGTVLARRWLLATYRVARPLARAGVCPDVLTLAGLEAALAVLPPVLAGGRWVAVGAALALVSAALDNVDGAVAAVTRRVTPFGSLLDSLVDRAADALYLVAFALLGAPGWLCAAAAGAVVALEYGRARADVAGFTELGVATVGERAGRCIVAVAALAAAAILPAQAAAAATVGAAVTAGLAAVGCGQFLRVAVPALRARG